MGTTWMDSVIAAEAAEEHVEKLARLLHGAFWASVAQGAGSFDEQYDTIQDNYRQQARWLLQHGVRLEVEE